MKLIKGWPNLRYLDISHCFSLTESGLINMLYHSTDLNYLNINGIPSVTDRWWETRNCWQIWNHSDDSRVVQILAERHSKSLKGVWLDGRQLSDSAILTITKKIPLLTEVSISNTIELSAGSIDHFRVKMRQFNFSLNYVNFVSFSHSQV